MSEEITVRQHIMDILAEREKATTKAEEVLKARLEYLNELRGNVITRGEYVKGQETILFRLEYIERWQNKMIGAAAVLGGIAGAVVAKLF